MFSAHVAACTAAKPSTDGLVHPGSPGRHPGSPGRSLTDNLLLDNFPIGTTPGNLTPSRDRSTEPGFGYSLDRLSGSPALTSEEIDRSNLVKMTKLADELAELKRFKSAALKAHPDLGFDSRAPMDDLRKFMDGIKGDDFTGSANMGRIANGIHSIIANYNNMPTPLEQMLFYLACTLKQYADLQSSISDVKRVLEDAKTTGNHIWKTIAHKDLALIYEVVETSIASLPDDEKYPLSQLYNIGTGLWKNIYNVGDNPKAPKKKPPAVGKKKAPAAKKKKPPAATVEKEAPPVVQKVKRRRTNEPPGKKIDPTAPTAADIVAEKKQQTVIEVFEVSSSSSSSESSGSSSDSSDSSDASDM